MAQFDADIALRVAVEGLEKAVRSVEQRVNKIQDITLKFKADGQGELKKLEGSFKRLANLAKTLGASAGVGGLAAALAALNTKPIVGGFLDANFIGGVVKGYGELASAAAQAAAAQPGLAAGIAAASAAVLAFGPQMARAAKDTLKLAKVAAEAQTPIENIIKGLAANTLGRDLGGFGDASEAVQVFRNRLFELNESVSNLRSRSSKLSSTLNKFNSDSETAARIALKLVDVNARLNNELREQADLLRRAKGVNVTELEASKGTKSIETRRKQEELARTQARENQAVQNSLERLEQAERELNNQRLNDRAEQIAIKNEQKLRAENNETIKSLERRIQIEERIANVRSTRVAREQQQRRDFLQGNPNQYGQGAVGPASGRADAIQAGVRAAQQRFAITSNITKQLAGQTFQYRTQLALLQKAAQIGKQIEGSIAEQQKLQRRLNRELKVRQGREKQSTRKGRGESLALGVGFPLLFGAGPTSVLGSAAGSFVGKGFGGQILGGAIGQIFDDFTASTAKLGQALNPLKTNLGDVVAALGITGTATEKYINALKAAGRETEAFDRALQELQRLVGYDGVNALRDFGDESQRLSNGLTQSLTQASAALAEMINKLGFLQSFAEGVTRSVDLEAARKQRGRSPELDKALDAFEAERFSPASGLAGAGIGGLVPQAATEAELAVLKEYKALLDEIAAADAEGIKKLTTKNDLLNVNRNLLNAQLELETSGLDLSTQAGFELAKKVLDMETYVALQNAINSGLSVELVLLEASVKLAALKNKAQQAQDRAAAVAARASKSAGSGANSAAREEERVQKSLASERIKSFDLDTKLETLGRTRIEQLRIESERINGKLALQTEVLQLSEKDNRVLEAKLANLEKEAQLLYQQNQLALERAKIEETIATLRGVQSVENLQAGLNQELAAVQRLPSGNVFEDEQSNLLLDQQTRRENALRGVNQQIEIQRELARSTDEAVSKAAVKQIKYLEQQKTTYETMLPQIFAAEQAQLKFNQALELVQGPVNAFVGGLTSGLQGIIDGTKSVEEAFADMLKGIADALVQTAAQMIAQYLAIAAARALAGIGGGGTGLSGANPNQFNLNGFGALFTPGGQLGFAEGGFVTRPTNAIVGEGGQPEYVIPASRMTGAMQRFNAGASGDAVINGADPTGETNITGAADIPITISTGPVMQFEGKNYVSQEEFAAGIKLAAKEGEAATLRRLRMSPSTRRKVGL